MTNAIYIHNASSVKEDELLASARVVEQVFVMPVHVRRVVVNLDEAFDGARGQYSSAVLLSQILNRPILAGTKHILVVDVDLFIPVLTFIYGEAQFNGSAAIVSTHRLNNEYYGLAQNTELFHERLRKEMIHELGHTFGLYHCHQFECVMRSSTYVEEIDLKRTLPCADCANVLQKTISLQFMN